MEFVILGSTALTVDGRPVPLGATKQRGMLALLLYHAGQAVTADTITEYLWGDRSSADHRASLYALASRIRTALGRAGLGSPLTSLPRLGAYRLDIDPAAIDYHRFRHLVAAAGDAADHQRHRTAVELLDQALALWHDQPVADLRGPQADHLRHRIRRHHLDLHRLLARSHLGLDNHQSVLLHLETVLPEYPLDERLAQYWIEALSGTGRPDDARAFFLEFRRRFRKAMRLEPNVSLPPAATARPGTAPDHGGVAVSAAVHRPSQLPNDVPDFTGHDDLIAELDAAADPTGTATSVVVVSGMPGVGKTTLATHWARLRRDRFPGGQLYLNANAYGPGTPVAPDEALGRFLRAFGVPADRIPQGMDQRRERLRQLLDGQAALILLDDVRDSRQASQLIPAASGCVMVVTSRTRLHGLTIRHGVRHITVPPLPDAACSALLLRIVGRVRAATDPSALHALARSSAGLPLALRIIGEHVAERPGAALADLVNDLRAGILEAGDADDDTTLRTVFAWSYEALDPDAARLFRILGMFPASEISPPAAAAMAAVTPHRAEQLLDVLARAHLVNHGSAHRYQVHDLLHRYASDLAERAECADPSERRRIHASMLDWYLLSATNAAALLNPHRAPVPDIPVAAAGVTPVVFPTDAEALAWCTTERDNLAAVTRWAATNGHHRHAWQLPGAIHDIFGHRGRQHDILELHELALRAARADGHRIGEIGTLNNLGVTYFALHRHRQAAAAFTDGLRLAGAAGYTDAETSCLYNLASVHLADGDAATALGFYQDVLATCEASGNLAGEANTRHQLGAAHRQLGQHDSSAACYHEALAIRERLGLLREQGATHSGLAALYLETGELSRALRHGSTALELHGRARDDGAHCDTLITVAEIHHRRADHARAAQDAMLAAAVSDTIGDSQRRCLALTVLAHALAAQGDAAAARRACADAMRLAEELPGAQLQPVLSRLAALASGLGPPTERRKAAGG